METTHATILPKQTDGQVTPVLNLAFSFLSDLASQFDLITISPKYRLKEMFCSFGKELFRSLIEKEESTFLNGSFQQKEAKGTFTHDAEVVLMSCILHGKWKTCTDHYARLPDKWLPPAFTLDRNGRREAQCILVGLMNEHGPIFLKCIANRAPTAEAKKMWVCSVFRWKSHVSYFEISKEWQEPGIPKHNIWFSRTHCKIQP